MNREERARFRNGNGQRWDEIFMRIRQQVSRVQAGVYCSTESYVCMCIGTYPHNAGLTALVLGAMMALTAALSRQLEHRRFTIRWAEPSRRWHHAPLWSRGFLVLGLNLPP